MAKPKSTDNGEPRKNQGEKPGKAAEKRQEARREAVTVGKRPQREKTANDGSGRDSEVRRKSKQKGRVPAISLLKA